MWDLPGVSLQSSGAATLLKSVSAHLPVISPSPHAHCPLLFNAASKLHSVRCPELTLSDPQVCPPHPPRGAVPTGRAVCTAGLRRGGEANCKHPKKSHKATPLLQPSLCVGRGRGRDASAAEQTGVSRAPHGPHTPRQPLPSPCSQAVLQAGGKHHGGRGGRKGKDSLILDGNSLRNGETWAETQSQPWDRRHQWVTPAFAAHLIGSVFRGLLSSLLPCPLPHMRVSLCTRRGKHGMSFPSFSYSVPILPGWS